MLSGQSELPVIRGINISAVLISLWQHLYEDINWSDTGLFCSSWTQEGFIIMDTMGTDDCIQYRKTFTVDGLVTKGYIQGRMPNSRCVSVFLGVLCVLLLAANVGQFFYKRSSIHPESADLIQAAAQKTQLETTLKNMTEGKDQLQHNYNTLKQEKDQLLSSYNGVQKSLSNLQQEKNNLQTQLSNMTRNRDDLQTSNSALRSEKDQLQQSYNTLKQEKDQLQTDYSSAAGVRNQLQKKIDALKKRPCKSYWKRIADSCFYVSTRNKDWSSSRNYCISQEADLAILESTEEQAFVNGLIGSGENAWIGLTDDGSEGTWKWVDGTPVTTTYWESGQPNSYGGDQDCGELVKRGSTGEWNDETCSSMNIFVCEQ